MSTSSISTIYGRCFVIFMACIILIEGAVYLCFAIWGLTQENCGALTYNTDKPFQLATDLLYFKNVECGDDIAIINGNNVATFSVNWSESHIITDRMYIFLIVYAAVSGIWILFSVLIIFALCGTITSVTAILFFWPWFVSVIAGSILDLVAGGYFISDITQTTTAANALSYVGISSTTQPEMDYSAYNSYFVTPPIVMTCISLRLVIIWILNVFGASFCISLIQSMVKATKQAQMKTVEPAAKPAAATVVVAAAPVERMNPPPQTPQQVQAPVEYPTQIQPRPLPIQTPPQTPAAAYQQPDPRSYPPQTLQLPYDPYPVAAAQMSYGLQSPSTGPSTPQVMAVVAVERAVVHTPASPTDPTTYRHTDTHPDHLNYPPTSGASMAGSERASMPPPAQLSNDSVLNNRYSVDPVTLHNQQRVSDELRSQLPWSYTSMLTKPPPTPRKPQVNIYPDIPEPDYVEEKKQPPQQDAGYSRW